MREGVNGRFGWFSWLEATPANTHCTAVLVHG
jgi:hypothetical protein